MNDERDKKRRAQPSPPDPGDFGGTFPWSPRRRGRRNDDDDDREGRRMEAAAEEWIYLHLLEVRRIVEQLLEEAKEAKLRRRLESVPVRVGDLMQGFQAAVSRANRAERAGAEEAEDIERMSIKDLEVEVTAPIIESAHAEDPVLMLPNIKAASPEAAQVTLKFSVVSVPLKQRG